MLGNTQRSVSVVNGQGRKVLRDGLEMLEAKYMHKDGIQKVNALENRIKRLVFEE